MNTHWGSVVEDNQFGTHEFFDLCEMFQDPERVKPAPFKEIQFDAEKGNTVLPPMSVCACTIRVVPKK